MVQGVQDGRAVCTYGEEGGMPHMEDAGLPQDDVERKGQQGIQADADALAPRAKNLRTRIYR